jgi:hypothetical protein
MTCSNGEIHGPQPELNDFKNFEGLSVEPLSRVKSLETPCGSCRTPATMYDYLMVNIQQPQPGALLRGIRACMNNGERLLDETYDLEFRRRPSSRFFLIKIAQEEFAKAFLLHCVKENVVPFTLFVLRAVNDHVCKQLVGMIMGYLVMRWEGVDELKELIRKDFDLGDRLPSEIDSAMDLLRHEKIGRWESTRWVWEDEPDYDAAALRIFEGKEDRHKQDALYVRIGRDGAASSTPETITETETENELERARQYKGLVDSMLAGQEGSYRYDKVMGALKQLFEGHG